MSGSRRLPRTVVHLRGQEVDRSAEAAAFALAAARQAAVRTRARPTDVRAAASRPRVLHGSLDRVGGLEHENLDCEVGIDVVLTHECDHLAIELPLYDVYEVVTHDELVVVAESDDAIRAAKLDEVALAVVSVSASRTVTMFSLIVVFALVGPRPVYSCIT